jgi:hypothetical protein
MVHWLWWWECNARFTAPRSCLTSKASQWPGQTYGMGSPQCSCCHCAQANRLANVHLLHQAARVCSEACVLPHNLHGSCMHHMHALLGHATPSSVHAHASPSNALGVGLQQFGFQPTVSILSPQNLNLSGQVHPLPCVGVHIGCIGSSLNRPDACNPHNASWGLHWHPFVFHACGSPATFTERVPETGSPTSTSTPHHQESPTGTKHVPGMSLNSRYSDPKRVHLDNPCTWSSTPIHDSPTSLCFQLQDFHSTQPCYSPALQLTVRPASCGIRCLDMLSGASTKNQSPVLHILQDSEAWHCPWSSRVSLETQPRRVPRERTSEKPTVPISFDMQRCEL